MEGDIDALRADTSAIDDLGIEEILEHYAGIIEELDSRAGRGRCRDRFGAGQGTARSPRIDTQVGLPGAQEPGEPAPGGRG